MWFGCSAALLDVMFDEVCATVNSTCIPMHQAGSVHADAPGIMRFLMTRPCQTRRHVPTQHYMLADGGPAARQDIQPGESKQTLAE